jgi:DNA-binding transcriptional LysR family regulator
MKYKSLDSVPCFCAWPQYGRIRGGSLMELRQLVAFVAAAETLHFGRAADRVGLAAPALSRQIKTLEQELGVALLTRTTRQVALTRAGFALLEEAKAILARVDMATIAVRNAHRPESRTLRVGAIDSASASFLSEVVARFRRDHPQIDIQFIEAMTEPLLNMLESGRLDLCLIRPPRRSTDCAFEVLRTEMPLVILPTQHPLATRPVVTLADLVAEPIIIPARRSRPYAYDLVMAYFESVGAVPKISFEATEKPAMMAAVQAGLGVALAPDWVARLSFPGVVMRKITGAALDPPHAGTLVGVAWRPQQRSAPRDAFLTLLRARVPMLDAGFAGGTGDEGLERDQSHT